ncbi:hemolysin family protein [Compostibacter hankyongensis]|uniref:Hemolysin family protein n=1 Tax=Compostibacter hankyongensis TaxID=1007089 RepID=A0ABP8FSR0_9BACT
MNNYQLTGLIATILLTAFFAGIEVAFGNVNKLSIELRRKQGILSGKILSRFIEQPARFVAVSLVGLTIMLVLYCIAVDEFLQPLWRRALGGPRELPYFQLVIEIFLATAAIVIVGIALPRAVFRARADSLLVFFSVPVSLFYKILYPVASLLVGISEWMLKYLFNVRIADRKEVFNRAVVENFFRQGQEHTQENQELNAELFENALSLSQVKIRACMIPRKEIEAMEVNTPLPAIIRRFLETKLSKLVIYDQHIDNILGYIHQLDLYKRPADIRETLHPILAVPETMSVIDLMSKFTQERRSLAWVVDEFGGTAGIVTLEDLLEEIFGEIRDEYDTEEFIEKQIADKEYIFSGRLEIDYLNERYGFDLPEGESETLSGIIIAHHETIPQTRERIIIGDFEFEVLNVTETRIETVKMRVLR